MSLINSIPEGYKSGFISLIGRPNVGKSTLINKFVGKKIAITSPVAQTTRNRLRAIITSETSQLILLDTPGIHKPHHLLGERLVESACKSIGEVDIILLIFDACFSPGKGDLFILNLLRNKNLPVVVALNKWDLLKKEQAKIRFIEYQDLLGNCSWPIYPCSAINGNGCDFLLEELQNKLPLGPQLYPPEMTSDQPQRILLAELIREQVLLHTRQEIPHSVAVKIDRIEELPGKNQNTKKNPVIGILATILVETKSQKLIVIGKGGSMLKLIGQGARLEMQLLIDGPIYLELFVKVSQNWRSKPSRLSELGYQGD